MRWKKFFEDKEEGHELSDNQKRIIAKLKSSKPTEVISLLASNDSEIVEQLEKGTEAYELWQDTLEYLNVDEVLSTKQMLSNIRRLKSYVMKQSAYLPYIVDREETENQDNIDSETTGRTVPKESILDNKEVQELLCDATRNFVRNIKQEFGNILLAFSSRLIGLMKTLYNDKNPARGVFYLVDDNSAEICSAIINAVSEYTKSSPSVVGVEIKKNTTDKRSLGLKHGVSSVLLAELKKIFDEEVVTNPEDAIILDSDDKEVVDVAKAINLSDLIHVNKARNVVKDGCYTIYTAFRMQKGGYSTNFNFGMQIVPISDDSFDVLYYLYLSDGVTKPDGKLQCSNWI